MMSSGEIGTITGVASLLASGIGWLIRGQRTAAATQARIELKVDTMWIWFTNHGSHITGYKEQKHEPQE